MRILGILCLCLVAGCATSYQKRGFTGGLTETKLDEGVYQIRFQGNGFTSGTRATDFALLRAAELGLEQGYKYFFVADEGTAYRTTSHSTPSSQHTTGTVTNYGSFSAVNLQTTESGGSNFTVTKPSSKNLIYYFYDRPSNVVTYPCATVYQSLTDQYEIEQRKELINP